MTSTREAFGALHHQDRPLLLPNPWDPGSARLLASLGAQALATTSSGFAATLGRLDGNVTRDEALAHAAVMVAATELPVSADLENGFAHEPGGVASTIEAALAVGLAGCSIEDFTGDADDPIYDVGLATERIAAAVDVNRRHADPLVLTARAENFLHGRTDLTDTITRLQAFADAGADVVYAPGLVSADDIRAVVSSVSVPVNVLATVGVPNVAELAELGVARLSVGGRVSLVALAAVAEAARELFEQGTYGYLDAALAGKATVRAGFRRELPPDA